jgi:hypothetical protein
MFGKSSAVDIDPRLTAAHREMMDGPCNDLFAASGLAGDQHRSIRLGDTFGSRHETLQGWAVHNRGHTLQKLRVGIRGQRFLGAEKRGEQLFEVRNKVTLWMWEKLSA